MEFKEKVYLATKFAEKGYDYETIIYHDDLYHLKSEERDVIVDEIWDLIIEYKEEGSKRFREVYKDYKMY